MADNISIGSRPDSGGDGHAPAPWEGIPTEPGGDSIVDLNASADALLAQARADARGKATAPVLKGPRQKAMLVAMTAGAGLAEHASPPAACLQVVSGRFRLSVPGGAEWVCGAGELVAIPPERHAVDCVEDGAFVLIITPPSAV